MQAAPIVTPFLNSLDSTLTQAVMIVLFLAGWVLIVAGRHVAGR